MKLAQVFVAQILVISAITAEDKKFSAKQGLNNA